MADLVAGGDAEGGTAWPALRRVFFGGDLLSPGTVSAMRAHSPQATYVNFYGASETPQAMGFYEIPENLGAAGAFVRPEGVSPTLVLTDMMVPAKGA